MGNSPVAILLKNMSVLLGMVAHSVNPSTWEAEASLVYNMSLGWPEKPCLEIPKEGLESWLSS